MNQNHLNSQLPWTGERIVTQVDDQLGTIEHLHRYAFALQYVKGKTILDIASGEGYGSNLLAYTANKVIGVDISEEAIDFASNKYIQPNLEYKLGSADKIPVDNNSIDVVVSFETLEHHDKHHEMMQEIKRVLKPDGLLIISTPNKSIYQKRDPDNIYHVKELFFEDFKNLIKKYFKETIFLEQKLIFGSLLSLKESNLIANFDVYNGDYTQINYGFNTSSKFINQPFFIVCVASDKAVLFNNYSFFDGVNVYEKIENKYLELILSFQHKFNMINNFSGYRFWKKFFKIFQNMF